MCLKAQAPLGAGDKALMLAAAELCGEAADMGRTMLLDCCVVVWLNVRALSPLASKPCYA